MAKYYYYYKVMSITMDKGSEKVKINLDIVPALVYIGINLTFYPFFSTIDH